MNFTLTFFVMLQQSLSCVTCATRHCYILIQLRGQTRYLASLGLVSLILIGEPQELASITLKWHTRSSFEEWKPKPKQIAKLNHRNSSGKLWELPHPPPKKKRQKSNKISSFKMCHKSDMGCPRVIQNHSCFVETNKPAPKGKYTLTLDGVVRSCTSTTTDLKRREI